eukprot:PhF_6_TR14968/c7_g1_i1/m.23502
MSKVLSVLSVVQHNPYAYDVIVPEIDSVLIAGSTDLVNLDQALSVSCGRIRNIRHVEHPNTGGSCVMVQFENPLSATTAVSFWNNQRLHPMDALPLSVAYSTSSPCLSTCSADSHSEGNQTPPLSASKSQPFHDPMPNLASPQQRKTMDMAKYKTSLCRSYCLRKQCAFGDKCMFAHGECELRKTHPALNKPTNN